MACTPASVRPAAARRTCSPAMHARARSRWSWTVSPEGCDCQPWKRLPSYSMPIAIFMVQKTKPRASPGLVKICAVSAQGREHGLRLLLLGRVALLQHFFEEFARPVLVAHLLVGLSQVELGCHLLPVCISGRGGATRRAQIQIDRGQVQRRGRCFFLLRREIQIEIKIDATAVPGGGSGRFNSGSRSFPGSLRLRALGRFTDRRQFEIEIYGRGRIGSARRFGVQAQRVAGSASGLLFGGGSSSSRLFLLATQIEIESEIGRDLG